MKHTFHRMVFCGLLLLIIGPAGLIAQEPGRKSVSLQGQFVCSLCWFEADRKTTAYGNAADLECARECAEKSIPPAIAVKHNDDYRLVLVEEGKLKKSSDNWLQYIGKQVRVSGTLRAADGKEIIALDELKMTGDNPLAQETAVLGTQPDLALKDLFAVEQKLSGYRGKVVVLNFWATWCIPCRKEMPDLAAIQNQYAALGVQVVGAAADGLADREKVVTFIKETGINFPVWLQATTEEMKRFGLGPALPGTVVIGRDGKVLAIKNGVVTLDFLKQQIDNLLASDAQVLRKEIASARPAKVVASSVPS